MGTLWHTSCVPSIEWFPVFILCHSDRENEFKMLYNAKVTLLPCYTITQKLLYYPVGCGPFFSWCCNCKFNSNSFYFPMGLAPRCVTAVNTIVNTLFPLASHGVAVVKATVNTSFPRPFHGVKKWKTLKQCNNVCFV